MQLGRRFALSDQVGTGVFCGGDGAFVGAVPLLQRGSGLSAYDQWQPRAVADLNRDLSQRYGLPVELNQKIQGLRAVARALGRGDLIRAQIAILHLQIPDPPALAKSAQTWGEITDLARQLRASSMLKADWEPAKHPRWPAGSPGGIGGEFATAGATSGGSAAEEQSAGSDDVIGPSAPVIPVQITIPAPFELPGRMPFPSEIVPPPALPDINPRSNLRNPYPDRPECEEEWAHALDYCTKLITSGRMGADGHRGFGRTFQQCVLGMVRQDCGGNLTS
jgi:hypothetical protein